MQINKKKLEDTRKGGLPKWFKREKYLMGTFYLEHYYFPTEG